MLQRLVEAAGCELQLALRELGRDDSAAGPVGDLLARHRREVLDVAGRHGLSNVRVFGSVARGEDDTGSDLDFLVDVPDGVGLFGLFRCQRDLEAVLGVPVDLVPDDGLKPGAALRIRADARAL